jgi:hypothetical protein
MLTHVDKKYAEEHKTACLNRDTGEWHLVSSSLGKRNKGGKLGGLGGRGGVTLWGGDASAGASARGFGEVAARKRERERGLAAERERGEAGTAYTGIYNMHV